MQRTVSLEELESIKIMRNLYILTVFTVILGSWNLCASAQNVDFPDANLAAAVRISLGLAEDADIPLTSLQELTQLHADNFEITNLIGLEKATRLTSLAIRDNPISDFAPLGSLINLTLLNLINTTFSISDLTILSPLTSLRRLLLSGNEISDLTDLPAFPNLASLELNRNQITDLTPLGNLTAPTKLTFLSLSDNQISNITPLARFTGLTQLFLSVNNIRDLTPLENLTNLEEWLRISSNQVSDLSPLAGLTKLRNLYFFRNQVRDLTPLAGLTKLRDLRFFNNQVSDLTPLAGLTELRVLHFVRNQVSDLNPLAGLTELRTLVICYNRYTDISPLQNLVNLSTLFIDEVFVEANRALVGATTDATLRLCPPLPDPPPEPETSSPEPEPEPEPAVKQRRRIAQCGLGWAPQSRYPPPLEQPKVLIYALEFEYDPDSHARYICNTIEIRTGDDSIENLAGWNLYLGTLYNPSSIPLKIPEEHSQITDRILRITPEMLGLETFPCNTVNGISHPLPGVQYVLKTDENVLIDTTYSCFIWGQNAYTTVNGKNVESPRRISSQALREMDTPRIERYVTNPTGIFITYIPFEDFAWDRAVLSDWLLASSEETVAAGPNAPFLPDKKLTTTWGAIKKHPILRQRNFKHKPAR